MVKIYGVRYRMPAVYGPKAQIAFFAAEDEADARAKLEAEYEGFTVETDGVSGPRLVTEEQYETGEY